MKRASIIAIFLILLSLSFGSLTDEAAQVTFALRLADSASSVSALLAAGLIGAIFSGPIAPPILQRFGPQKTVPAIFLLQSFLIAGASLANQFGSYIAVSMALGCTGALFWSAIMVAIPTYTADERHLDRITRLTQSVRNLGYACGPALGGVLYSVAGNLRGLLLLAVLVFLAAPTTLVCFKILDTFRNEARQEPKQNKQKARFDLVDLLRSPGVIRAVAPLLMTVILTSALNVLLIFRIRTELGLSAEAYGLAISMLSIGLIFGPVTFSGIFSRFGDAAGASFAAGLIGLGILWLSLTNVIWIIVCATFLIGSANGIQNALMASFMMKAIDPQRRVSQMPAYVFCIQLSVFLGFIGAGLISTSNFGEALRIIGISTTIIGTCGFGINVKNRPNFTVAQGAK
ncbi:MFS transporter [Paraburkholderia oxyphila]|uniref:MFS transporter n=1 Tax=Paraburkholderia oxyphila TaxID=614212 RepID=UPI0005BAABF5|nr:MFS transporter [Paraburkholderia oxyphila]